MAEALELSNGRVTIRLHAEKGVFDAVDSDGQVALREAAFGVLLDDGSALSSRGRAFRAEGEPPSRNTPKSRLEPATEIPMSGVGSWKGGVAVSLGSLTIWMVAAGRSPD